MNPNEVEKRLHDRATRGEVLPTEEQVLLKNWYAQQDQEEEAKRGELHMPQTLETLQAQVDVTMARIVAVSQRIQTQTAENDVLRREIANLQRQLVRKPATQPA